MRRGFTLIELLVVIAIIAILAAILFPVFAKAREKARQTSCLSNVKQMILGVLQYAQDYDELLVPGIGGAPGKTTTWPVSQSTAFTNFAMNMDLIYPYVNNVQMFFCPSGPMPTSTVSGNYGFNAALCPDTRGGLVPQRLGNLRTPAETFIVLDAGPYMISWSYVTTPTGSFWYVPGTAGGRNPAGEGSPAVAAVYQNDYVSGRHNEGINVGLADGHAKWFSGSSVRGNPQWWTP